MLIPVTKNDRSGRRSFKEFLAKAEAKAEHRKQFRQSNQELTGELRKNPDGSESWICRNASCNELLVKDINGSRAMLRAVGGMEIYVKYFEMYARCPKCKTQNYLMDDNDSYDNEIDMLNEEQKSKDTFFMQDEDRALQQAKLERRDRKEIERDYLLKLK